MPQGRTLHAVRVPLGPGAPIDPWILGAQGYLVAEPGRILVGLGTAATVDLPGGLADEDAVAAAHQALTAIDTVDGLTEPTVTRGPVVAFAALPFDRGTTSALVVASLTYGRESDGTEWVTVVAPVTEILPRPGEGPLLRQQLLARMVRRRHPGDDPTGTDEPQHWEVALGLSDTEFEERVARIVDLIDSGLVTKVVLARHVDLRPSSPIDEADLLRRWRSSEPNCTIFAMPSEEGRFVGASPELLVARSGATVSSLPLAGTRDRHRGLVGSAAAPLLSSDKDSWEHRLVVDAIVEALAPVTTELSAPPHPQEVTLRTVTHLGTPITGTLRDGPTGRPSALQLVSRLHPTPAVGGVPRPNALGVIADLEPERRGPYAGPVGWMDNQGNGQWMVGIRAAWLRSEDIRLTAGVGVVAGSTPSDERNEVRLKLHAVLDVLAPGLRLPTGAPDPVGSG